MNEREAAIVSVHTGKLIGPVGNFTDYAAELLGHRLHPSEYWVHRDELIKLSEEDYKSLTINLTMDKS